MNFRLVDSGWDQVLDDAVVANHSIVRVSSPFIKQRAAQRLLSHGEPKSMRILTRFNLDEFIEGVSDIAALRLLLKHGAQIRGIQNLHSKVYVFGDSRAIVTSANLTEAALLRNHEFGFVSSDADVIGECVAYFDELWNRAGNDLVAAQLDDWESRINTYLMTGTKSSTLMLLGDEGVNLGFANSPVPAIDQIVDVDQAIVKFFGNSAENRRLFRETPVIDEVKGSSSHWRCNYPLTKRPRKVTDGALVFLGRLVQQPNDVLIYGSAKAMRHVVGRDDATEVDILERDWMRDYPHYLRLHHAEFLAGTLGNGISLYELMDELGADAFASTQRNAAAGSGNINPRHSIRQQPDATLSREGMTWLNTRLEDAFERNGKLQRWEIATLERPSWPIRYHA